MRKISSAEEAYGFVWSHRVAGRTVGIVPTMGALHEGHLRLAGTSVGTCDCTVATIFVNPTQFAAGEDLEKYPRTLDADCAALEATGVDAVFLPGIETMYPDGFSTMVGVPEVGKSLEGVCRPTHFAGVTTIVLKLFQILPATHAFFGKKDFQQLRVIEAMVRDLNLPIKIAPVPIVRESDGLALSSRNRYLSAEQRERALLISRSLEMVGERFESGVESVEVLQEEMRRILLGDEGCRGVDKIDYATIVHSETLSPITKLQSPAVALIAAYVGNTRLIDNREF